MHMGPAQRQPYRPGGHVPRRHRILQQEVRWRPPKCDSRVPGTLVPDGAAPRTQGSNPSTLGGLGALNERFDSRVPLDATPLGGHRLTSDPSTTTTRAPSVSSMIGWVSASRRASPNVGARTCSICARVALRRVVPCAAPEALGGLGSLGTCPVCTPSGCGRSARRVATAHAHEDPAPRAGCTRVGRVFQPIANSWLILPPHHHNLRHLRAAPRRRHERAAAGPPGPRAARRPPLSRSLGPHMARERTHRRRRGARVPSHCVAHTPAHSAPHDRSKVHAGRSRPGCVTVAGRLPRRRAEPGVHLPRAIGAPPHTAHGPGSRLYCRTGGTIARWLRGVGGWLGRALRRSSHRTASGGARAARAGLRGGGGRTCRTATGGTCRPHACLPPGKRTCRSCWPQGGSGKLVTFVLPHPRARDARGRKLSFLEFCPPFR